MLEEILLNHKKGHFVHSRVEVTNQQREIEKQKRLANMKNIEWGKSKMKRNSPLAAPERGASMSSDGIFKHDFDHNDNDCKLKDQMMVNPSLIIPFGTSLKFIAKILELTFHFVSVFKLGLDDDSDRSMSMSQTPSPTEEALPASLNDVFEMNPLFRDDNPPFSRDLTLTGISIPEVRIIDRPVDKFNDIERDQIVTLTVEDIAYLQDPIAFGLFKIIEREFTKHFKSLNALREELT